VSTPGLRGPSSPPARRPVVARLELVGSALSFGLMAVLARRLSRDAGGFTAGQLSVVRFVVGAGVTALWFALRPGTYRPSNYRLLVSRGISGGLVVVLYFFALARIPAGEAGLLYNLFPVIATAMSVFTLGERPTRHLLLGLVLATAGVVLVLGGGTFRLGAIGLGVGELAAVAAAFFAATSANVIRAMRGTENATTIFFFFCLAGLPVVLPFALTSWPTAPGPWAIAFGMALAALAAQVLMADAYGSLSVSEAAVWLQLTPIAQVALAAPLLGERVTGWVLAGVLLGVGGVAWATLRGKETAATLERRGRRGERAAGR
jgi:drug/metabolite transporter (DMT)-like permease